MPHPTRRRRLLRPATVLLAVTLGMAAWTTPADAAVPATPTVSNLDGSTPGSLSLDVTSPGGDYIGIRLGSSTAVRYVAISGPSDSLELSTWGWRGPTTVFVRACSYLGDPNACSSEIDAGTVDLTDVTPTVTWSANSLIKPGNTATVTITDPTTGPLFVSWPNQDPQRVSNNGTTDLVLGNGQGQVELLRCQPAGDQCSSFATRQARDLTVVNTVFVDWERPIDEIRPTNPSTTFDVYFSIWPVPWPDGVSYTIDWSVDRPGSTDLTGQESGTLGVGSDPSITIDGATLPQGERKVTGTITLNVPDWGPITAPLQRLRADDGQPESPTFDADLTGPQVDSVSQTAPTIYPRIKGLDGRPTSSTLTFATQDQSAWRAEVVSSSGVVRARHSPVPVPGGYQVVVTGTNSSGDYLAAGRYLVRLVDTYGNSSLVTGAVTVSGLGLVQKTMKIVVSPSASIIEKFVGACSTLRRPASRGWSGSIALMSATRCQRTSNDADGVFVRHRKVLPTVLKYVSVKIEPYGGASVGFPDSQAILAPVDAPRNKLVDTIPLIPRLGRQTLMSYVPATKVIASDRSLVWDVATFRGNRYDIKQFDLYLKYVAVG